MGHYSFVVSDKKHAHDTTKTMQVQPAFVYIHEVFQLLSSIAPRFGIQALPGIPCDRATPP